jgi:manganese/zinc/iron transport system substrate-binding protein
MKIAIFALIIGLSSFGLAQEPLNVLTTIGMLGDVAENVGGACVAVSALIGPGLDPHLYRASAGDVQRLEQAELILYGGLNLEAQLGQVLGRLGQRRPTLAVMEQVSSERLIEEDEEDGEIVYDPHLWMDAALWAETIDIIAEAITDLRPECREAVAENAESYRAQLLALDAWARDTLTSIPEAQRILITAHDAFYYFAEAYGFTASEGIQGISTEAEASIADIRAVVDEVVASGVRAIFPESTINPRTVQAVQAAVRDRGFEVAIGDELYSDAMGDPGTPEGTYIGMIRSNVIAVTEALGGEVAPWPSELADWAAQWGLE